MFRDESAPSGGLPGSVTIADRRELKDEDQGYPDFLEQTGSQEGKAWMNRLPGVVGSHGVDKDIQTSWNRQVAMGWTRLPMLPRTYRKPWGGHWTKISRLPGTD